MNCFRERWLVGYSKGCAIVIPVIDKMGLVARRSMNLCKSTVKSISIKLLCRDFSRGRTIFLPLEERRCQISEIIQLKCMAIHECLFINREDHFAFEVAQAIETGVKLS